MLRAPGVVGPARDGWPGRDPADRFPESADQPLVDVALLRDDTGPDETPRLLTVDAVEPEPGVRRLAVLRRDSAWGVVSELDVDLGAAGLDPWLVGLSPTTFALLAVRA